MRWYADNSELNGIKGAEIPDILIFGGVAVPPDDEKPLRAAIESVKSKFGLARAPIKWNFKDLKAVYKNQGEKDLYEKLLASSQEWRSEIFSTVSNHNFCIIVACVEAHSIKRNVITNVKDDITRFVFNNGLMRFAIHVEETRPLRAEVILDWPDKGQSKPFDVEYDSAYKKGVTCDGIRYHSGQLEQLGFLDSSVYTNMKYSTLLQFADLVVGATREFVECALGKKKHGFGVDMLRLVRGCFRGYPQHIVGRGISVASNNPGFKVGITNAVQKLLIKA